MTKTELEAYMYEALNTKVGKAITTSNPELLRTKLYAARKSAQQNGIEDFNSLAFNISPTDPNRELWIVRKNVSET
jgi:hypothetical protein